MEETDGRIEVLGFKPQQEIIYNKLLPYTDQLDDESNKFLAEVKGNLSRAVQLRELRPGVFHWTTRLSTYIRLYGRKFSKEDHLYFINLYFELITIPNLELRLIEKFAKTLIILLKKRNLLSREDLVLPWKPLYQLTERCLYSPYEPLGLEWFPQTLESDLKSLVRVSRVYFSVESTQEMLDEFRPLLCPFDETMSKGIGYLELFLPTLLPPEHHDQGFKLWLDELLGIWDSTHNSPIWEGSIVGLFARVSYDNIGYIDWTPYVTKIFSRFMRGFNLPVGSKKLQIGRMGRGYDIGLASVWIVSMLGHGSPVQENLDKFFTAIESYFHPSNFGRYSFKIQRILFKLPSTFVRRLHRERYKKPSWQHPVPDEYKLTDEDITAFVESIKTCTFLSMFSKMGHMDAAAALQNLALMRPELIIPQILEKTYIALDTLTEPHQLIATVSCVVAVARTLLKGGKWLPEGPTHLLPLLNAVLPGIDPNDFTKCMVTFQAISTFTAMVPLVDCSMAPLHRDDITEQERDICSATAGFEDFLLQFMDRCFTLIEASVIEHTNAQDRSQTKVNQQENMVDVGLSSTFSTMLSQCSPQLFEAAVNRLYSYISTRVFETKVSGKMIANMCRGASKVNPTFTLKKFIPLCSDKILSTLTEHEEVQLEEELDDVILFNLQILGELVRSSSEAVLVYKDTLFKVLHSTLHLTCKTGYELSCTLLKYLLRSLTMLYPKEYCSIAGGFDKPLTEYLPMRDWAKPGDIHNLGMSWQTPTENSITVAKELLDTFLQPELTRLREFSQGAELNREKLLQTLNIVYNCIIGAGSVLPRWNKPYVTDISESQVAQGKTSLELGTHSEFGCKLFADLKEEIATVVHDLLHHMLATGEDDTKALVSIANINNSLLWYRGAIKQEFDSRWKSFTVVKRAMANKLHGKKQHLRALLIDRVYLQHEQRILEMRQMPYTALDRQILKDLFIMSTSRYSEVRKKGQAVLFWSMEHLTNSKRDIMPMMIGNLKQDEQISHQQFKGALYLLQGYGLGTLACITDWSLLKQCWTALVQAGHSEKPSIMKVIDCIAQKINKLFDTPSIKNEVSDGCIEKATVLYQSSHPSAVEVAPSSEEMADAVSKLQMKNEDNLRTYNSLVIALVEMVDQGDLRWKFSQMAISFLTLLLRHDSPLPVPAIRLFVNNLAHETLVIRKLAIAAVAAIFKQSKREHKKIIIDPYNHAGCQPPTQIIPGTRPDNLWLHYDSKTAPKTKDEWEKCVFVEKTHWGYYVWPKSMKVYAPNEEQPKLDRTREELSEGEQLVYDFFTNESQVSKLIGFLSLEERKGKDKFDSKRFILFKGLFRNYGDMFVPTLKPHLERLASDTQESSQRCLAEIVAALIRGSKHWPFEKVSSMWELLTPMLRTVLNQLSVETVTDWGTSIATACESRDPRKLDWLFEVLLDKPIKESGSFLDASALYVLQGGLMQQEWRVPGLLHRLLNYLDPFLTHSYKNVRDRIGSLLTTIFLYDYTMPNGTLTTSPHRKEFVDRILPKLEVLQNPETWATSLGAQGGNGASDATDAVGSDPLAEERQTAIRLCKTVMKWLTGSLGRMVSAASVEMFQFLPLVVPLESFECDEELRQEAEVTLAYLAQTSLHPDVVLHVLQAVQQIAQGNSWRAKCSMMAYLQVMVYNNLFVVSSQVQAAEIIHDVVLDLLKDDRLEVREMAGVTLSGLLHCGFFTMHPKFQGHFEKLCKTKLPKKLRVVSANNFTEDFSLAVVQRHAGILGLSACVQAYPYDVPEWMPQVLMDLTDHLHDPQPIEMTVRKVLSDFRRTHHDNWHEHKQQFTDDQLVVLTDLLVSPCYYA